MADKSKCKPPKKVFKLNPLNAFLLKNKNRSRHS